MPSQIPTDYKSPLDLATDIQKVTYYSDGKNLNATLWLGNNTITDPAKFGTLVLLYGVLFDIDKNPGTGKFGVTSLFLGPIIERAIEKYFLLKVQTMENLLKIPLMLVILQMKG
jgi:hypothetical protein